MRNKDLIEKRRADLTQSLQDALDKKDANGFVTAFTTFAADTQADLLQVAQEYAQTNDKNILASRGIRQLTDAEEKFYNCLGEAAKSDDPKQAFTGLDNTIPTTIIDTVLDDIEAAHPLLAEINFRNTTGITEMIYSDGTKPLATWGTLTAAITAEISETIHKAQYKDSKLSAFIPIPIALVELGASYLDAYCRTMLSEALAFGLEHGVLKGTGKNQPIGMVKDLDGGVVNGEYSDKEAVALTELTSEAYGNVVAMLSKRANGRSRTVGEVLLVVNPTDNIKKIRPATTVRAADGTYSRDIFPHPTKVVESEELSEGEAVLGIAKNYLGFIAGTKIEYSDEYQWLEDNRVYKGKTIAYGLPKDNTSFIKLDISGLKPPYFKVKLVESSSSSSNESSGSGSDEPVYTYTAVESPTGNPSTSGYYEKNGDVYTLSEDTEVDAEKTYYTRDSE